MILKRNELIEVKIEDHVFPATGVGHLEGKKVKIKGAFVGETVSAKAFEIRADRAKGRYQGIIEKADYSVDPICPHFGKCGGCISQQIPLEKQRVFKEEEVLLLFKNKNPSPQSFPPSTTKSKTT